MLRERLNMIPFIPEMEEKASELDHDNSITETLKESYIREAETDDRFCFVESELHLIETCQSHRSPHYTIVPADLLEALHFSEHNCTLDSISDSQDREKCHTETTSRLQCIFQPSRPEHVSGRPDKLPFRDAESLRDTFDRYGLPASYLLVASGNPSVAHSHEFNDLDGRPQRFEFIAHCNTKQGNWAMALSHTAKASSTSAFWSVDENMNSIALSKDLQHFQRHASHPMLLPCIAFARTLHDNVSRRNSIKVRLQWLEHKIMGLSQKVIPLPDSGSFPDEDWLDKPRAVDYLINLLHGCKTDQCSREGRYEFWRSFHGAILKGFDYVERAMNLSEDEDLRKTHAELKQWTAITWQTLESLKARDRDHNSRVKDASDVLYNLIGQRDTRIQSSIARSVKRDSEDMKFIALLGAVFLPASLVASILNVQEFQFLPGGKLFGVYIAITLPFVTLVVMLCVFRPSWTRRTEKTTLEAIGF